MSDEKEPSNVINLADVSNDSLHWTVDHALRHVLEEVQPGGKYSAANKVLILLLDKKENNYDTAYIRAGLQNSDCVALMTICTQTIIADM